MPDRDRATDHRAVPGPDLVGGRISLDFANSEGETRNGPPEWITTYGDLLRWAVHAGAIEADLADRLEARAADAPDEAARIAERAVQLREALYRVFVAAMESEEPAGNDLAIIDEELGAALAHLRIAPDGAPDGPWRWRFEGEEQLGRVLWPLARDAADLLSSDELARLGQCSGEDCTWLFVDRSRNHSRRWCDMAVCGNRSKARRYYERSKEQDAS